MEKKSLAGQGLREFITDFGIMDRLVCDESKEQTSKGTDFIISHNAYLKTIQDRPHVREATHQGDDIHRYNGGAV